MKIRVEDFIPVQDKFFDENNKLMRIMNYKDIKKFGKKRIPTILEILPQNKKGNKTTNSVKRSRNVPLLWPYGIGLISGSEFIYTLRVATVPRYHDLCFGVTQKPIYFPNINLVCASRPGRALKTIIVTGIRIH